MHVNVGPYLSGSIGTRDGSQVARERSYDRFFHGRLFFGTDVCHTHLGPVCRQVERARLPSREFVGGIQFFERSVLSLVQLLGFNVGASRRPFSVGMLQRGRRDGAGLFGSFEHLAHPASRYDALRCLWSRWCGRVTSRHRQVLA